jgi:hypothetical protein
MADFKLKYPSANTVDLTITLASLATNAQNVFTAGRESTAVDNTTNLDLDHLLSGRIRTGTTPTVGRTIAVYVYAPVSIASGVPTYPDVIDGTDSAETFTSANVLNSSMRLAWATTVDATSDRDYSFSGVSVASLFGGVLPPFWGVYVAHDTAVALNATGSNHAISYFRVQTQSV